MHVLDDKLLYIDIDDTLVFWNHNDMNKNPQLNNKLIEKIKEWKKQGWTIILWTSNSDGAKHAEKWAKKAKIEHLIFSSQVKPHRIVDDDHLEYYEVIDPKTFKSYRKIG